MSNFKRERNIDIYRLHLDNKNLRNIAKKYPEISQERIRQIIILMKSRKSLEQIFGNLDYKIAKKLSQNGYCSLQEAKGVGDEVMEIKGIGPDCYNEIQLAIDNS